MKILWMTWKDRTNPLAGGAEVVNEELAKRLVADGHEVILLVGGYKDAKTEEVIDGYKVVRLGNRYSVYWKAWRYYRANLRGWADLVIDEVNTMPFFAKYYVKERNILFAHMLCREIWFYQLIFPLSLIGYLFEPIYLWMLRDRKVITVSESTKNDLIRAGFKPASIDIISEGIEISPLENLSSVEKYPNPTLLSLGSIRPMKRTLDQVKAFELAKATIPTLKLKVAGDSTGRYGRKVLAYIAKSPFKEDIEYVGRVDEVKKIELMQKCHAILVTSVKEGWGLIVTEAASQGTPAIVYNVDGLRDSVLSAKTGLISAQNTPTSLAEGINSYFADNSALQSKQNAAWNMSKKITFKRSYTDFKQAVRA